MDPADHVSEGMPVHRWKPIEDLPADRAALDRAVAEVAALRRAWAGKKAELEASGALTEFNARLSRQWCIETGILEGIYTLDRGATQMLIEHGFDAALLSHGDTNIGERRLIEILRDHERTIEGLFAFVKQARQLSTSYVKELHSVLLAHQAECHGVDQFGNDRSIPLLRGDWKRWPNNPGHPRSPEAVHEYCPPEHVAAEMDQLVERHALHGGLEPELAAAWLHHRFTQIHPFQDGNGRVARALASLVLIQGGGFPFVVLREQRDEYFDALRTADDGDPLPFVEFVCRLQKKQVLHAIQHGGRALARPDILTAILEDARRRLHSVESERDGPLGERAVSLRDRAFRHLQSIERDLNSTVAGAHGSATHSDPTNEHVYAAEAEAVARALGYSARSNRASPWVVLHIEHGRTTSLVISLHSVANAGPKVMAASAFIVSAPVRSATDVVPSCDEPFTFTADRAEVETAFDVWLEHAIKLGLAIWARSL